MTVIAAVEVERKVGVGVGVKVVLMGGLGMVVRNGVGFEVNVGIVIRSWSGGDSRIGNKVRIGI